jgi:hypothetical protein
VVTEVGLVCVLLTVAGLLTRSLSDLDVDRGFTSLCPASAVLA